MKTLLLLTFLLAPLSTEDRDWKTGKLLDTEAERYRVSVPTTTRGKVDEDGNIKGTTSSSTRSRERFWVAVETEDRVVIASRKKSLFNRGRPNLTVGASVKYFLKGSDLYLLDEDGKEFKFSVEKKMAR